MKDGAQLDVQFNKVRLSNNKCNVEDYSIYSHTTICTYHYWNRGFRVERKCQKNIGSLFIYFYFKKNRPLSKRQAYTGTHHAKDLNLSFKT